jgi:hypothetical protein
VSILPSAAECLPHETYNAEVVPVESSNQRKDAINGPSAIGDRCAATPLLMLGSALGPQSVSDDERDFSECQFEG